ncbi:hypothetical protein C0J52_06558 [Blattella germanica]|nr:hypothetical protein C0J52_06558 [Blattella germanica]
MAMERNFSNVGIIHMLNETGFTVEDFRMRRVDTRKTEGKISSRDKFLASYH